MMELLDMGKYNFYVWGSIGVFVAALLFDFVSAKLGNKQIKRQIKAKLRRKQS